MIRLSLRLLPLTLLALVALPFLPAHAAAFRVKSPDQNTVAIGSQIDNRVLRYDPKRKELTVVITTSNVRYATTAVPGAPEDIYFTFPGVSFDAATNILSVVPPTGGDPVPIGEWKKGSLGGHAVLLYVTAVLVTVRDRTTMNLALDVDTERTVEGMKKKAEADQEQPVEEKLK